jgi:hypothetical protein
MIASSSATLEPAIDPVPLRDKPGYKFSLSKDVCDLWEPGRSGQGIDL